jgi:hypothetical protein
MSMPSYCSKCGKLKLWWFEDCDCEPLKPSEERG